MLLVPLDIHGTPADGWWMLLMLLRGAISGEAARLRLSRVVKRCGVCTSFAHDCRLDMCASSCRLSKSGSAKREHEVVKVQAGLTMGQRESCELGVEWPVSPQMLQYCWHLQTVDAGGTHHSGH